MFQTARSQELLELLNILILTKKDNAITIHKETLRFVPIVCKFHKIKLNLFTLSHNYAILIYNSINEQILQHYRLFFV